MGGWQLAGLGVLAVGQFLLRPPSAWGWGTGEIMILLATLLWAAETILAKKVLPGMTARTAAFGRMGVGAGVMWLFLAFTGRASTALTLTGSQWFWVMVTSIFLMGYVWTWYSALKVAPAVLVTSVLILSAIITILLDMLVEGQIPTGLQLLAILLMVSGGTAFLVRPSRQILPGAVTG